MRTTIVNAAKAVPIPLANGGTGWITAGPTKDLPTTHRLVRCAEEIPVPSNRVFVDVGTRDFSPFDDADLKSAVPMVLEALEEGQRLYVGCMGGTGRTGTFLAVLVAQHPAFTGPQAIRFIRDNYKPGAVETEEQIKQVYRLSGQFTPEPDEDFPEEPPAVLEPKKPVNSGSLMARLWASIRG